VFGILTDTPELRARRRAALSRGECIFNTTVLMGCTGRWHADDWCNVAVFSDRSLTGFLPTVKQAHKGTL